MQNGIAGKIFKLFSCYYIYTVSGIGIRPLLVPMAFAVDHPFILNIITRDLNAIFSGHIVEP